MTLTKPETLKADEPVDSYKARDSNKAREETLKADGPVDSYKARDSNKAREPTLTYLLLDTLTKLDTLAKLENRL